MRILLDERETLSTLYVGVPTRLVPHAALFIAPHKPLEEFFRKGRVRRHGVDIFMNLSVTNIFDKNPYY